jgi:hypothetical protein
MVGSPGFVLYYFVKKLEMIPVISERLVASRPNSDKIFSIPLSDSTHPLSYFKTALEFANSTG